MEDRTDFIESRSDVIQNIKTLYAYLSDSDDDVVNWASSLLKNGRNYVIEVLDNHVFFAPSRFVGYKDNSIEKHQRHHGNSPWHGLL